MGSKLSYGALFCGADPFEEAWPQGQRVFSCDKLNRPGLVPGRTPDKGVDHTRYERVCWKRVLDDQPLDLLIVGPIKKLKLRQQWTSDFLDNDSRPQSLLVVHRPSELLEQKGTAYKQWTKDLRGFGYTVLTEFVRAAECGAALWEGHFMTIASLGAPSVPPDL